MLKIELEIPEPMAAELRDLVAKGYYQSEEEIVLLALAVFLRRMNRQPLPRLSDEELRELETRFMLEDIEWGLQQKELSR